MKITFAILLLAGVIVFIIKQRQKAKDNKVPEPRGVKDVDDRHG